MACEQCGGTGIRGTYRHVNDEGQHVGDEPIPCYGDCIERAIQQEKTRAERLERELAQEKEGKGNLLDTVEAMLRALLELPHAPLDELHRVTNSYGTKPSDVARAVRARSDRLQARVTRLDRALGVWVSECECECNACQALAIEMDKDRRAVILEEMSDG